MFRWYTIVLLFLVSCNLSRVPRHHFNSNLKPPTPDYTILNHWAAHPDKIDGADTVPPFPGLANQQADARVDVFYLYPTLYFEGDAWNASVEDGSVNKSVQNLALRHQATVFNGSCRIYAPYYRQMTYHGFFTHPDSRTLALELAYEDVRTAFLYYLENFSEGRPFIIAGHSQGSLMAKLLLEEFMQVDSIRQRLVAAYCIGWVFREGETTDVIPLCDGPEQTGCFVTWNTMAWGKMPKGKHKHLAGGNLCVNPLNWTTDGAYAGYQENLGGLARNFDTIYPNVCDAQVHDGFLWIHRDRLPGLAKKMKRFHTAEYNLYWMNIRENVALRIDAYFRND